jgi:hypothetical protein
LEETIASLGPENRFLNDLEQQCPELKKNGAENSAPFLRETGSK